MHFRKVFHTEGRKKFYLVSRTHLHWSENEFVILISFSDNKKEKKLNCIPTLKCCLTLLPDFVGSTNPV